MSITAADAADAGDDDVGSLSVINERRAAWRHPFHGSVGRSSHFCVDVVKLPPAPRDAIHTAVIIYQQQQQQQLTRAHHTVIHDHICLLAPVQFSSATRSFIRHAV